MENRNLIQPYVDLFDEYLREQVFSGTPDSLYQPVRYILKSGGKRFRPSLCLMGCHLYNDHFERALPQALALELFHTFTLVHDDIMDQAPTRRGRETIHTKWNESQAILSGDLILILAYRYLDQNLSPKTSQLVLDNFNRMAIKVCEGQQQDTDFESMSHVRKDAYLNMIRKKTAVLLGSAVWIGSIVGGATEEEAYLLDEYIERLGMAFQIQDDILDVYGDHAFGKKRGGDIAQGKKTLLQVLLSESDPEGYTKLQNNEWQHDKDRLIEETIRLYDIHKIKYKAGAIRDEMLDTGLKELNKMSLSDAKRANLEAFGRSLVARAI